MEILSETSKSPPRQLFGWRKCSFRYFERAEYLVVLSFAWHEILMVCRYFKLAAVASEQESMLEM